jgi:hypothetical protein
VWTIHLVDVFNDEYEEHMGGSPYTVTVSEGPTDPASCVLDYTSVMTAGDELRVAVNTSDAHDNPTVHSTDAFRFSLDGTVVDSGGGDGSFTFSQVFTRAVPHTLAIVHFPTNIEVAGSPLSFTVLPGAPDAASSVHNIDIKNFESEMTSGTTLELRVYPFDRFNNTAAASSAFTLTLTINDDPPIPLLSPSFSYSHPIPTRYSGPLRLSFQLNGEDIKDSPVSVAVAPDWTLVWAITISGSVLAIALAAFVWHRRISNDKLIRMESDLHGIERSQSRMVQEKAELEAQKDTLEQEMKMKKHSEEELKVMVEALEAVSKERQDELKEVMIDSSEVKVEKLLGKVG